MPQKIEKSPILKKNSYARLIFILFGLILIAIVIVTSFFPIDNYDIWWHLQTGRYMLTQHSIPDSDMYSFTASGKPWITHEWLAEIIFYLLYSLGGLNLLIIFKVVISVSIASVLMFHLYKRKPINFFVYILVAAAICIGSFRLFVRPHLFTYLFLTILCLSIFKSEYFDTDRRFRLVLIPGIFLIWANIHSGFVIGLGLYWVASLSAFIKPGIAEKSSGRSLTSPMMKYIVPPGIATLAALVNPNGIMAFEYPFKLASEPVFKSAIAEMVSPFEIFPTERLYWMFLLILIGFAIYGSIINIRKRPGISIILIIGCISALMSIRNAYEFALITATAGVITYPTIPWKSSRYIAAGAMVFVIFSGYYSIDYIKDLRGIGFGIKENLPEGAADFLNKIDYRGNIYSPLGWASYFIWRAWPDVKVFIDGRLLVYGPDLLNEYHYIRQNETGALDILGNSGADAVALPIGQKRWYLREAIDASPDWQLCYFDDKSVLFLKKDGHNRGWLESWGYQKIDPLRAGYLQPEARQADTTVIMAEAKRAYDESPGSVTTNAVLARAYFLNSRFELAAKYYKETFLLEPRITDFLYQVATSYHHGGELDSAAVWYNLAIAAKPQYEQAYLEYGAMEAGRGNYEKAIAIWRKNLEFDPKSPARNFIEDVKKLINPARPDTG